jgi:hypothetical protein
MLPPKSDGSGQINLLNPSSRDVLIINGSSNFKLMPNLSGGDSWSKGYQQNYALNYVGVAYSDNDRVVVSGKSNFLMAERPMQETAINDIGVEITCIDYDSEDGCRLDN